MSQPVKCEKRKRNRFELGLICEELIRNSEDGMVYIDDGEYIRHIEATQKSFADFFGPGAGESEISQALKLVRRAEPEVIKAVKNGIITPTNATKIVKKSNTREGQLQLLQQEIEERRGRKRKPKSLKSMEDVAKDAKRTLEIIDAKKNHYQASEILRCICDLLKTVIEEKADDAEIESEVTEVLDRIEEIYEELRS